MIKENKYFETVEWKNMSGELKSKQWNFARTRKEAHIVKDMKNKFMDQVKAAEDIANKERVRKKQLKNEKYLKLLIEVKKHGGPLTPNDIDKLGGLTDTEVLTQVKYLHQTVAPIIREKRKVGHIFVKFTREELEAQILNVLKPENKFDDEIQPTKTSTL